MASFTDIVPQFNPYVSQLPVEAMVKVGMEKQKRYDEGVQKIQGYINNIAGLDVAKDIHKEYLQSKLNELGNDLTKFAAADFSNYQLVNSVSGMTSQIVKDPVIQNAVASTKAYRDEVTNMNTARKAGKSSDQNDEWFSYNSNKWFSDGDLSSKFNVRYKNYTDIKGKLRDIAEKVHEYDNSVDIPFQRDAAGNVIRDKNNQPVVDMAMLTIKTKGKKADKILQTFYDSLTEDDKYQLKIDSWYNYRGVSREDMENSFKKTYNDKRKMLSDSIVDMNVELVTGKYNSAERAAIQAKINDVKSILNSGKLDMALAQDLYDLNSNKNLDDIKYKLYTEKTLTGLAKDMAYESVQQEIKANPYFQAEMQIKDLQFKYDDARQRHQEWLMDYQQKDLQFWTKLKADKEAALGIIPVTTGAISTDIDTPTLIGLDKEITDIAGDPKTGKVGALGLLDGKYSVFAQGMDDTGKKKFLNDLYSQYMKDPSRYPTKDPNLIKYVTERRGMEIQLAQKRSLYTLTVNASKVFDEQIDKMLGSLGGINTKDGKSLFTAKELFEIAKDSERFYGSDLGVQTIGSPLTVGTGAASTFFKADQFMNKYKGTRLEPVARAFVKSYYGGDLTPTERLIVDRSKDLKLKFREPLLKINQDKLTAQSEFLASRMPERMLQIGTLDMENKLQNASVRQIIGNKLDEFNRVGSLDVRSKSDFVPSTVQELLDKKGTSFTIAKKYDGSAELTLTNGDTKQIVPMTKGEVVRFFPQVAQESPINEFKYATLASDQHTTNVLGRRDESGAVSAFMTGYSIPNLASSNLAHLVRLDIEGDPDNVGDDKDKYAIRMYVNDNGIWKQDIITQQGYITGNSVVDIINNRIGPATIADFLTKH